MLSPRKSMLSRFSTLSSVISSVLLRVRFMCASKVCRVPRIVLLFRSLIMMTLLTQPSNILIISEDNYSPQNYVDSSWTSLCSFTLFCSSSSRWAAGIQYSNFQIFSLFFIVGILFISRGLFNWVIVFEAIVTNWNHEWNDSLAVTLCTHATNF